MMQHDVKPLEDFAIWAMLQKGRQESNIPYLKELVHDMVTMLTQKSNGRKGGKGIPWEAGSKAIPFENFERIKMMIVCEAMALVLSGDIDKLQDALIQNVSDTYSEVR